MTTYQFYYLLLAVGGFMVFMIAVALSYISYRRWLRSHPDVHA